MNFNVPQLLGYDNRWLVLVITIVRRPFSLDFASAYLGAPPKFSAESLADWEEKMREDFGERWPTVQLALARLRELGIHQTDVSPGNFGFED